MFWLCPIIYYSFKVSDYFSISIIILLLIRILFNALILWNYLYSCLGIVLNALKKLLQRRMMIALLWNMNTQKSQLVILTFLLVIKSLSLVFLLASRNFLNLLSQNLILFQHHFVFIISLILISNFQQFFLNKLNKNQTKLQNPFQIWNIRGTLFLYQLFT